MTPTNSPDISALLHAWSNGDQTALDRLTPLVYGDLRRLAKRHMRNQYGGQTLQTTALVHEAYLHLANATTQDWVNRAHFFAASAQIMRRVLIDAARARTALKRGGGLKQANHSTGVDLDDLPARDTASAAEILALDDALQKLTHMDQRKGKVVELRFFGGLSIDETADVLNVSPQTVLRDWRLARLWLAREISMSK